MTQSAHTSRRAQRDTTTDNWLDKYGRKCLEAVEGMFVTGSSAYKRAILVQELRFLRATRNLPTHFNTTFIATLHHRKAGPLSSTHPCDPPVWLAQCRHHRSLWLEGIDLPLAGPSANAAAALAPGRLARCTGEWPIEGVPSLFLLMDAVPVPLWHDTIVPVKNTSGRRRYCRRFRRDSGTGTGICSQE